MVVSRVPNRQSLGESHLRVLTYNVYGHSANWEARRPVLIDGLRELAPDLIALQETIVTEDYDQAADLLDGGYWIVNSRVRQPDGSGVSIASRWPIEAIHELDLQVNARAAAWACTTLIAEIEAPGPVGPLVFVNHLPSYPLNYEHERELQTVIAARAVEEMVAERGRHVVLAGDLDADPDAASIRFLIGKQSLDGMSVCYRNAWDRVHPGEPGHTFTSRNPLVAETNWDWPFQRIDHIMVRFGQGGGPSLDVLACELAFDEPINGVWASDHFALVADLAVPESGRSAVAVQ